MTKRTDRQVARGERIIDKLRSQMYAESDADFGIALGASNAGQANLMAQTRAGTRSLMAAQRGNSAAINGIAARARAQSGRVAAQEAGARNRYGSALGSSISQSFAPAAARAAGTGSVLRGYAGASRTARRTAGDVAGIAAAGVQAQGSAAKYAMAQALQQRNIIDNQTLAALTGDLYKQAIAYNQQWSLWKRQQDYAAKLAEKTSGGTGRAQAEALMAEGSTIAIDAANAQREFKSSGAEGLINVNDAATDWAAQNGYETTDPQYKLYVATLRNISHGMSAADAYAQAARTLFSATPGFEKWGDAVIDGGMSGIEQDTLAAYLESKNADAAGQPLDPADLSQGDLEVLVAAGRAQGKSEAVIMAELTNDGFPPGDIAAALKNTAPA